MRSFVTCTVLASVASMAVASVQPRFEYPEGVPAVEKRQEPGTPRYACHENCGTLITLGRTEGYCDTSEWSTRYSACMACANEFGIWMYYSSGVTNAAKTCGLTPVPSPSGAAGATTTAAPPAAPPAATTTAAPPPAVTSTTAAAPPPAEESSSASSAPAAEESSAPAASTTPAAGTTLTTAVGSSTASGAAATTTAASAGSSSASATRVVSIGTSVVIPSGTPTPTVVFAGASRNAGFLGAAVGVAGLVVAAF